MKKAQNTRFFFLGLKFKILNLFRISRLEFRAYQRAFSLVEMLIYAAILALALVIIAQSGASAFDRLTRDIRQSQSINVAGSTLGAHPGKLILNTSTASGTPATLEFYVESGALNVKQDSVFLGALTSPKVAVSNLIFRSISTAESSGVKIELSL